MTTSAAPEYTTYLEAVTKIDALEAVLHRMGVEGIWEEQTPEVQQLATRVWALESYIVDTLGDEALEEV